jgi:hypothetical protein
MSSRTAMTIVDQAATPESGPSTKTLENFDVSVGNKIENDGRTVLQVRNTTGAGKTITYTYSERGQTRTTVVNLGANEETVLGPFPPDVFNAHAGDAENGTHLWATANGSAGEVKGRAIRMPPGAFR